MAAALNARGEDCLVVPAEKVRQLERPCPVHSLQFTKSGVAVRDTNDRATPLGWEELAVLAVAHVAVETSRRVSNGNVLTRNLGMMGALGGVTGAALGGAFSTGAGQKTVKSSDTHQFLDFVGAEGTLYFRIDGRQFDYSILGEQRQAGSTANLLTLARWLLTYNPALRSNLDAADRSGRRWRQPSPTARRLRERLRSTEWWRWTSRGTPVRRGDDAREARWCGAGYGITGIGGEQDGVRGWGLEVCDELLDTDPGLSQDTTQRAHGKLAMERHHAANVAFGAAPPHHDVTATLSDADKAEALQRPDQGLARHALESSHIPPRRS